MRLVHAADGSWLVMCRTKGVFWHVCACVLPYGWMRLARVGRDIFDTIELGRVRVLYATGESL